MAPILCIETSSALCSVALVRNGNVYYKESTRPQAHAEVLAGLIQELIQEAGVDFSDLAAVAVSGGPGSYTGLRIGVSTAKGLCFALQIPLISVDTLKIIAHAAIEGGAKGLIWPMIDARRMEVYHSVFDQRLNALTAPQNGIITDEGFVPPEISGNEFTICGDGALKAVPVLGASYIEVELSAAVMCNLAQTAFNAQQFADLTSYEPFYLKQANITSPSAAKA